MAFFILVIYLDKIFSPPTKINAIRRIKNYPKFIALISRICTRFFENNFFRKINKWNMPSKKPKSVFFDIFNLPTGI